VRALAVFAVLGFHEGVRALPGGFLGVDVFFVLSGYLITDLLAKQHEALGWLDLQEFWVKRARRLLPMLVIMLVIVAAAVTMLAPGELPALRPAALAAVTYTSNWYQALHHMSYFDAYGPAPPLQHLWSLAIEEQFYLAWPVLLWLLLTKLNTARARTLAALGGAVTSAIAMAVMYRPGSDPSLVYYGTDTHASALLIGAALALTWPLERLGSASARLVRRLDIAGVAGFGVLAWAAGHFTGSDPAVYPAGLIITALAAACLVAAAAAGGVISAIAGLPPLRWLGIRSYGIYLWHWPVIALAAAVTGPGPGSLWLCGLETGLAILLASASWRYIESPVLRNGFRVTCLAGYRLVADSFTHPTRGLRLVLMPRLAAAAVISVACVAGFGVLRPATPSGLMTQVAAGERISSASQLRPSGGCRLGRGQKFSGRPVTAIGDSVMVASAPELAAAMPGIYINAQVGRHMNTGLALLRDLAARGWLRRVVVVGLGTNGPLTTSQIRRLRGVTGPSRDLVFVNTYGPMSWEPEVNRVLAAATRHQAHVALANWHQAIASRTSLLWQDGIHPQPRGGRLYARVVVAAVRAALRMGSCRL
jgi:peptidoglycan/LPS O-acetylase OafA/YrhL